MTDSNSRYWIAVACAEHARRGKREGFMQVCHGKGAPLRRLKGGDGVVYYSPTTAMGKPDRLQAFTTIGWIKNERVYQTDMGNGAEPFRRDVAYHDAAETPIASLLDQLEFTRGKRNWGYSFRFGLIEISPIDFGTIARAMGAPQTSS
jgi:EVE domain-containing protein